MYLKRRSISKAPTVSSKSNPIEKIRSIPIVPRALIYIFIMGGVGGVLGEVNYRVQSTTCTSNDSCWVIKPAERRIGNIEAGAMAGIFAATIISVPAIVND